MANLQLSVADMPDVDRAIHCALPIIFASEESPAFPGIKGTCTALRYRNECVFVTAAHVVQGNDCNTAIYVPLGFSASEARCQIKQILTPRAADPNAPTDLAMMRASAAPDFVGGESSAFPVPPFARMDLVPPKALFAVSGYPLDCADRNCVDYDARTILFGKQMALGTYDSRSPMNGLHMLRLSTADTGGPNGFSGGPVFRLLHDQETRTWTPAFAGIVTNGGPECVHFIDAEYVVAFLSTALSAP